ncbi:hypothetical protein KIPB_007712, partial [Kipferlia bialata]
TSGVVSFWRPASLPTLAERKY